MAARKDKGDDEAGVTLADVLPGSAAAAAGLKAGDRLLTLDGRWTDSVDDCFQAASGVKPGEAVEVVVRRGGQEVKAKVTPLRLTVPPATYTPPPDPLPPVPPSAELFWMVVPPANVSELASPPDQMAPGVTPLLDAGVNIIGACCGSTPEHIRAFRNAIDRYLAANGWQGSARKYENQTL